MAEVTQNTTAQKGAPNRQRKKSTRIDMTAMVDVAFLLLTFFILTTTLAAPHALQVIKPTEEGNGEAVKCSKILEIYPGENDHVYWYAGCDRESLTTTDFSEQGIREVIRTHLAANPELVITLKPTPASRFSNMVDALDEMKITGAKRYALADLAPEDIEMLDSKNLK
jgi:biopolymer transport protein ExbD